MKPTKAQIKGLSATIGAMLFTIASLLVIPLLDSKGGLAKIAAALVAALSIDRAMSIVQTLLVKWWASDLLGEWFYFSEYSENSHFAHANVYVRGGDLHYGVDLYHLEDITAIAEGSTIHEAKTHGHAKDRAFFYDGAEMVEILYEVERPDDSSGQGVLKVNLNNSKRTMSGYWVTARDDEGPRSGTMQWYRREEFLQFLESQPHAQ